jgi:signal transduction histidine kinase
MDRIIMKVYDAMFAPRQPRPVDHPGMEIVLDCRPCEERPAALLEQQRLVQLVACLQLFIGHELPNTLVPCQGFARLLGEQADRLDEEGRLLLGRLTDLTQKADRWAKRLADIGRLLRTSGWGPAVDLVEVAREAIAEVQVLGEAPGVAFHLVEPMPAWEVDRPLLHAVLVQLLRNSARAVLTNPSGPVEVAASLQADSCLIQVKDRGTGLAEPRLLLEPFDAARVPGSAGPGLGFFLVRQAVARWGGSLRVASEVGQGTTVELLLPRPGGSCR